MSNPITVETNVNASVDKVWQFWTQPEHIVRWAFASPDWEAPRAENDLREGGRFTTVMAAKDKSASFDFGGVYTLVEDKKRIDYNMDEAGRHVRTLFTETPEGVKIVQTFDPEMINPPEMQRQGWQSILDNFKEYAEKNNNS